MPGLCSECNLETFFKELNSNEWLCGTCMGKRISKYSNNRKREVFNNLKAFALMYIKCFIVGLILLVPPFLLVILSSR